MGLRPFGCGKPPAVFCWASSAAVAIPMDSISHQVQRLRQRTFSFAVASTMQIPPYRLSSLFRSSQRLGGRRATVKASGQLAEVVLVQRFMGQQFACARFEDRTVALENSARFLEGSID